VDHGYKRHGYRTHVLIKRMFLGVDTSAFLEKVSPLLLKKESNDHSK